MEVPFLSSGAVNHSHYTLVHKLENAQGSSSVDNIIRDYLQSFARKSRPSFESSISLLVSVMYCSQIASAPLPRELLESVFRYAVDVMEGGKTYGQRRTGYHFCMEMLPPKHPLLLMLVNTLIKDLQSIDARYNLLALSFLSNRSSDLLEPFPAFQTPLTKLITSVRSVDICQKAMLTISLFPLEVTRLIWDEVKKAHLHKSKPASTTKHVNLGLLLDLLSRDNLLSPAEFVQFTQFIFEQPKPGTKTTTRIVRTFHSIADKMSEEEESTVLQLLEGRIKKCSESKLPTPLALEFARLAPKLNPSSLKHLLPFVKSMQRYLSSRDPNVHYVVLSFLQFFPSDLWSNEADNSSSQGEETFNSIFREGDVKLLMSNLDSNDILLRKKTLSVLNGIDPQILTLYFDQLLSYQNHRSRSRPQSASGEERPSRDDETTTDTRKHNIATRALEVAVTLASGNGENDVNATIFFQRISRIFKFMGEDVKLTSKDAATTPVQQDLAEVILFFVQKASKLFQASFVELVIRFLVESDVHTYRTMLVIGCAILAEYLPRTTSSGKERQLGEEHKVSEVIPVLSNLFVQANESPSLQELLLLTMLRLFAEVEIDANEPTDMNLESVRHSVKEVRDYSTTRKYIRSKCDEFLDWSTTEKRGMLCQAAKEARSPSLPAFALSLHQIKKGETPTVTPSATNAQRPESPAQTSRLLYKPYETPTKPKRPSRPRGLSSYSTTSSNQGPSKGHGDGTPRIMSAGDLSLLTLEPGFEVRRTARSPRNWNSLTAGQSSGPVDEPDLLSLDNPFLPSPTPPTNSLLVETEADATPEMNAETTRDNLDDISNAFKSRGWTQSSKESVLDSVQLLGFYIERINGANTPTKVSTEEDFERMKLVKDGEINALLEIKALEGACIWKLTARDEDTLASLQEMLNTASF